MQEVVNEGTGAKRARIIIKRPGAIGYGNNVISVDKMFNPNTAETNVFVEESFGPQDIEPFEGPNPPDNQVVPARETPEYEENVLQRIKQRRSARVGRWIYGT